VGASPPAQLAEVAARGHLPLELGQVLVAYGFQAPDEGGRVLEAPYAHHDVYDWLGREARHSGAPDVLYLLDPGTYGQLDAGPLALEERWPTRVVRDYDDGVIYAARHRRSVHARRRRFPLPTERVCLAPAVVKFGP
jgi:hypothetical protein